MRNEFVADISNLNLKDYLRDEPEPDKEVLFWLLIRYLMDRKLTPGLLYYTNEAGEPCYSIANYEGVFTILTDELITELQNATPGEFDRVAVRWYKTEILK